MKNIDVIKAFRNGHIKGQTKNLRIEGNRLMSYNTCIAEREVLSTHTEYTLNVTKYSQSTSRIQDAMLREFYDVIDVTELTGIPMGSWSLLKS
jgi:hypothetical protein